MYGLNVFLETTLDFEFIFTVLTLKYFTFMYGLYVSFEMTLSWCFIVTILT